MTAHPVPDRRPVAFLDVDGVVVLEHPSVAVVRHSVSADGRWRRDVLVPQAAPGLLHLLDQRFQCVWASAWAHTAHPALRDALDLPPEPWPWLGVQFHKLAAIRGFAAGRPWAWIDDGIHDLGRIDPPGDGVLVPVDPARGLTDLDPDQLLAQVTALSKLH